MLIAEPEARVALRVLHKVKTCGELSAAGQAEEKATVELRRVQLDDGLEEDAATAVVDVDVVVVKRLRIRVRRRLEIGARMGPIVPQR